MENISLIVEDHGIGMAEDEIKDIFSLTRPKRKKGTSEEAGSGLGLLLVKELVEKNGATVHFKQSTPSGLTVTVVIPKGEGSK